LVLEDHAPVAVAEAVTTPSASVVVRWIVQPVEDSAVPLGAIP
jgi:hypothetical protein